MHVLRAPQGPDPPDPNALSPWAVNPRRQPAPQRVASNVFLLTSGGLVGRDELFLLQADNMRLEPHHHLLLAPFLERPPVTLAHAASRLPYQTAENYTAEGKHVRCFQRMRLCTWVRGLT